MSKEIFITPTDIASFSYCEVKWEFDKKYRDITKSQIIQKLNELTSKGNRLSSNEKDELEFYKRLVKKAETLDRGEREHTEYSNQIAEADNFLKIGIFLIVVVFVALIVYLLILL